MKKPLDVQRIWDGAPHNAFTDLVRFQEKWFCVFREGESHVSADGALRVITSRDGNSWTSAALITDDTADLRDAKLSVTPDRRLMLVGAAAVHQPAPIRHQSRTWFSVDGRTWGAGHDVGHANYWLWRVTWHKGVAYGIGYGTGTTRTTRLYISRDGVTFESLVEKLVDRGYSNESSLVFLENGTCLCLLRRDVHGEEPSTGLIGIAAPPYTDWTWKDLGVRVGGPDMIQIPDGRLVAAVRFYGGEEGWGPAWTSLCWIDADAGTISEFQRLPSGGDTSYAGMVWHEDLLWVSYYSSHEQKTSIYLARMELT